MIASSTRSPSAITSAPSVIRSKTRPVRSMTTNPAASVNGTAAATTMPTRQPRLMRLTIMITARATKNLSMNSPTASPMFTAWSTTFVRFTKVVDQAVNIGEAVGEFMLKFFVALAVIMIVSLISLGWRVGIVVAAAVPLTLAAGFVVMLLTGRVFDRITLGALVIALGLLVDDAIIAIEMMVVKLEEGFERLEAAAYAWSHTAAPMLSGTLVTIIGFTPVGFARSTAGEYAGNIFWIVGYALIVSWLVAVVFTPYLGVKLLPDIAPVPGGHTGIYSTPRYQRLRRLIAWAVDHRFKVAGMVVAVFLLAGLGMGFVKRQFFPSSDRPEVLVEVQMPEGASIQAATAAALKEIGRAHA